VAKTHSFAVTGPSPATAAACRSIASAAPGSDVLLRAHARTGRITPKAEWVGLALLKRLGADGQCDPTRRHPGSRRGL
jgi:hypothetical protein